MSRPSACTSGIQLHLEPVCPNGTPPDVDRVHQVVDPLLVGILPTGNDLEDEVDVPRAGIRESLEHPRGVDDAGGVVRRAEGPVVVGDAIRLLQLDLDEPACESPQPGIGVALLAGRSGHALVTDVEAEPAGDAVRISLPERVP